MTPKSSPTGWTGASRALRRDLPIQFVHQSNPEWQHLPAFWTHSPPIPVHLGLAPLPAMSAIVLADHHQAIKIKVPRGLPDPTPNIPSTNPPSYGRWRLGKQLFFEPKLKVAGESFSCSSCHKPEVGFADGRDRPSDGAYNTLSLINVIYNRRQFWDGRVQTLEETLVRSLDDERTIDDERKKEKAFKQHIWGGFVRTLVDEKRFNNDFKLIFGVENPNQDTVAKALANYMRTILSGDSLFDRAEQFRHDKKAPTLTAEHFKEELKDPQAQMLLDKYSKPPTRAEMPFMLAKGYELFKGKAALCGVPCGAALYRSGLSQHRLSRQGGGAADRAGGNRAFAARAGRVEGDASDRRIPDADLRNLSRTRPYFHDGSMETLPGVVAFYDEKILFSRQPGQGADRGWPRTEAELTDDEKDALVMFLRSLQGRPVDPIVAAAP